jgi:DNA-directed RNA polymerase sigma subunit (sigma70/sigma32)
MGERIEFAVVKGRLRLKPWKQRGGTRPGPQSPAGSLSMRVAAQRLISLPDAASCRDLQEETRLMLSALTNRERAVLRMRFGIGAVRHCSLEEIARHFALESGHVPEILAQALRTLRHPGGGSLKSISCK